jgi:non-specific serine/threonine protein kinase
MSSFPQFDRLGRLYQLAAFSALAAAEGQERAAVCLAGATAALMERTGIQIQPTDRRRYERWLATAWKALGEDAAAAAWADGHEMRLDQAIAYAQAPWEPAAGTSSATADLQSAQAADRLTLRQREVAVLIAQGLTNRQIAAQLVDTERAAAAHVENILHKLGVRSRAQIAVWVIEHGLFEQARSD